jgi:predicted transcriptional regulator
VPENARHVSGAALFAKGFGNNPQAIRMQVHHAPIKEEKA